MAPDAPPLVVSGTMTATFAPGPAGAEPLAAHLAALYRANPALHINLRADRTTGYEWVEPVLQAVSTAAARVENAAVVARVNLIVIKEE